MAVTFDAAGTAQVFGTAANVTTAAYTGLTPGASATGLVIYASLGYGTVGDYPTAVWDSGGTKQSMTLLGMIQNFAVTFAIFGLLNPTTGAGKTCTVTWATGSQGNVVGGATYIGATQFKNLVFNTGSGTSISVQVETNSGDIPTAMLCSGNTAATLTQSNTEIYHENTNSACTPSAVYQSGVGTGLQNLLCTANGANNWTAIGINVSAQSQLTGSTQGFFGTRSTPRGPTRGYLGMTPASLPVPAAPATLWGFSGADSDSTQLPSPNSAGRIGRRGSGLKHRIAFTGPTPSAAPPPSLWGFAGTDNWQPPSTLTMNLRTSRVAGVFAGGDVGTEGPFVNFILWGYDAQPGHARQAQAFQRGHHLIGQHPGIEGVMPVVQKNLWGFDSQPGHARQPSNIRIAHHALAREMGVEKPSTYSPWGFDQTGGQVTSLQTNTSNRRVGVGISGGMTGDPIIEGPPAQVWYLAGWDQIFSQPPTPTRLSNRRSPAIDGLSAFAPSSLTTPFGFEQTYTQPPSSLQWLHRRAAIMQGEPGIEATKINFYPWGFDAQPGHARQPANLRIAHHTMPLATGIEGTMAPPVQVIYWGFAGGDNVQPPSPNTNTSNRRVGVGISGGMTGDPIIEGPPAQTWYNWGFQQPEVTLHVSMIGRYGASLAVGDPGIEAPNVYSRWGFDLQPFQPPHRRPERWAAIEDDANAEAWAVEAPPPVYINIGFEGVWPQPPARAGVRASGAIARGDDGSEQVLINFYPSGFDLQSYQPQHLRPERSGALARGDDGFYLPALVSVPITGYGFDLQNWQPPHPRPERSASLVGGDQGIELTLTAFYSFGWPIQMPQPPHPRPERFAALEVDVDVEAWSIEAPPPQYINWGSDGIYPQPPNFTVRRGAAFMPLSNVEATYTIWLQTGWEVQPYQPPYPLVTKRAFAMPVSNVEYVFTGWQNAGWEVQPPQPPHPRPERTGAIMVADPGNQNIYAFKTPDYINMGSDGVYPQPNARPGVKALGTIARGIDGIELPLINFYPTGFEVQPFQPPHRMPERGGGTYPRGDEGIEFPLINFYPTGYEIQPPQPPHPKPERSGSVMRGDDPSAYPILVPPPPTLWGHDLQAWQPQHQRPERQGSLVGGDSGIEGTYTAFYPYGWPVQPPQPPHPRPERVGCLIGGDSGTEQVQITWLFAGWEIQPPQPPHPRPERVGAIEVGEQGIENVYFLVAPQVINWGFDGVWPQPPHPRPERFGTLIGGDVGIEATYSFFIPYGWPVQPPQPPHPRWEKFATLIGGDPGTEGIYINWQGAGWEVQPPQPPHPRPERSGSIAKGDDGEEYIFFPVAPQVINWGFDGVWPQPPHQRPERSGSIAKGDEGIEGTYQFWRNGGWEVQPPQPPHPKPERSGSIARWEDGIEAKYVYVPPPQITSWFTSGLESVYVRAHISHLAGAILPVDSNWYIRPQWYLVFYACSTITAGFGLTSIHSTLAQTVLRTESAKTAVTEETGVTGVTSETGQTTIKGEPKGGPCE